MRSFGIMTGIVRKLRSEKQQQEEHRDKNVWRLGGGGAGNEYKATKAGVR